MEFGFEFTGAKGKRDRPDDAPTSQPMRAGQSAAVRRAPDGDQKKMRRQLNRNRKTAGGSGGGEGGGSIHLLPVPGGKAASHSPLQPHQASLIDPLLLLRTAVDRASWQADFDRADAAIPREAIIELPGGGLVLDSGLVAPEIADHYQSLLQIGYANGFIAAKASAAPSPFKESSVMHTEAELLAALAVATPDEQVRLVADLDALRRAKAREAALDTEVMWGDEIIHEDLAPSLGSVRHTAESDWLGVTSGVEDIEDVAKNMRAQASRWYTSTNVMVRQDPEEYLEQMRGMASRCASMHPEQWADAFESFVAQATHLRRTEYPEAHMAAMRMLADGPNPQSGYGESSLPGEILPTDAPEVQDNFAPEVAPENAWIDEADISSERMPVVQENAGGPSAESNQTGTASLHRQASAGWWIFDGADTPQFGPFDTQLAAFTALGGAGIVNTAGFHIGLGASFADLLTQGSVTHRYPAQTLTVTAAEDFDGTHVCEKCGADIYREPGVGWVDAQNGDNGGTYDECFMGGKHKPAETTAAHTAESISSEEAKNRVETEVENLTDPDNDPMWPWEQDANTPGTGAANVSGVSTPGQKAEDYPQPKKSQRLGFNVDQVRQVVESKSYAEVDGMMLDIFTASHIMAVYDNLSEANRERFASMNLQSAASTAFKLLDKKASLPTNARQAAFRDRVTLARIRSEARKCAPCTNGNHSGTNGTPGCSSKSCTCSCGRKGQNEFKGSVTAAEGGNTCATCGAAIERDPEGETNRTWHHNDGATHDHEATPAGGDKTSASRHPFGERKTAATCACAHNSDGSVTTMLCPLHAPEDPCWTMARVTGNRRKGSIVNGTCTACGWSGGSATAAKTADRDRATNPQYGDQTACKNCGMDIEYHGPDDGWIDRGSNSYCDESGASKRDRDGNEIDLPHTKHQPNSDRVASRKTAMSAGDTCPNCEKGHLKAEGGNGGVIGYIPEYYMCDWCWATYSTDGTKTSAKTASEGQERAARVDGKTVAEVQNYLPRNYRASADPNDPSIVWISGRDSAGWTLDGYVIPRLASGLIFAKEVSSEGQGVTWASRHAALGVKLSKTREGYEATIGRSVYRVTPNQPIAGDPTGERFPWVLTRGASGGQYEHGRPFACLADVRAHLAEIAEEEHTGAIRRVRASDLTWHDIQYQEEHGFLPDNGSTMDEMVEFYGPNADPEDVREIESEVALRRAHEEIERLRAQIDGE